MGEPLATGDEDEFKDAAEGSDVASPRRGTAAVTTEMKVEPEVKEEQEEDTDAFGTERSGNEDERPSQGH
ncbi:hypothetical protein JG688_00014326 [Phytophthora aleatoria]|uniref:Uncharacterized protein n=1 Tax=Phytophthora aleatoria TaxID=2496075 RepID=A0A8J5M3C7_9STRA|nr:hypothetical protein JG688_00014326 [Phytophthora aleatoria]